MNENDRVDDVLLGFDPAGGITIKTADPHGDPVELSSADARRLAKRLLELADQDDG